MFKAQYSDEEYAEIIQWFEQHENQLPERLKIIDCLSTDNLKATVDSYLRLLRSCKHNVIHCGYMAQLLAIREALRRDFPNLF